MLCTGRRLTETVTSFRLTGYFSSLDARAQLCTRSPRFASSTRDEPGATNLQVAESSRPSTWPRPPRRARPPRRRVTGNVTVIGQLGLGYVTIAPSLTTGTQPTTSTINFPTGDIRGQRHHRPARLGREARRHVLVVDDGGHDQRDLRCHRYFLNDAAGATSTPSRPSESSTRGRASAQASSTPGQADLDRGPTTASTVPATATAVTRQRHGRGPGQPRLRDRGSEPDHGYPAHHLDDQLPVGDIRATGSPFRLPPAASSISCIGQRARQTRQRALRRDRLLPVTRPAAAGIGHRDRIAGRSGTTGRE